MLDSLPLFHRLAQRPVIVLGAGEAAQAKRRLVERAGAVVFTDMAQGLAAGARLAFIAHETRAACAAEAARLTAAGVLVNVVDQPDLCDFTVPSLLDRAPVLVAVGTGGASAGLAKALRLRLEMLLPQGLGDLARALGAARASLKARLPDNTARRQALDAALGPGGALDLLDGAAAARVAGWAAGDLAAPEALLVELHIPSADPEELTLRQARLLGSADGIAHEPGVAPAILHRARADAARRPIAAGEAVHQAPGAGLWLVLRSGVTSSTSC